MPKITFEHPFLTAVFVCWALSEDIKKYFSKYCGFYQQCDLVAIRKDIPAIESGFQICSLFQIYWAYVSPKKNFFSEFVFMSPACFDIILWA